MGGQDGSRGYLVQALICVLDALDGGWDSLTIEPDEAAEKVDIIWDKGDQKRVVQVKSSRNSIALADAKRWSVELFSSIIATEYELRLIGPVTAGVASLRNHAGVIVPTPQPLNLSALVHQAAHKLDAYLNAKKIQRLSPMARELLVEGLVSKLFAKGTSGTSVSKTDFDSQIDTWINELQASNTDEIMDRVPHELPSPPGDFTGRIDDLEKTKEQIEEGTAYIAIRGMGGIGKTAFALRLAKDIHQDYPDGQIFVDLGGINEPISTNEAMVKVITSMRGGENKTLLQQNIASEYRTALYNRRVVILYDNATNQEQIDELHAGPGSLIIYTSRMQFSLPGMLAVDLPLMTDEECIALIHSIEPRIQECAAKLALLCGHLPLALRISASTLRERIDIQPSEYIAQLEAIGRRSQLIEPSLEMSIQLLLDETRRFFFSLAVFPKEFDLSGAAAINDLTLESASDEIGKLLRHNLVEWNSSISRYKLHDLVRDYVRNKIPDNLASQCGTLHSMYYSNVAEDFDKIYRLGGESVFEALQLFDLERLNITAGFIFSKLRTEDSNEAAGICNKYATKTVFCRDLRFSPQEQAFWIEGGLKAAEKLNDFNSLVLHSGNMARVMKDLGEYELAIQCQERMLKLSREHDIKEDIARALLHIAHVFIAQKNHSEALSKLDEALTMAIEAKDTEIQLYIRNSLFLCCKKLGNFTLAKEHLDAALLLVNEASDPKPVMSILLGGGAFLISSNDKSLAIEMLTNAKNIAEDLGHNQGHLQALYAIGEAHTATGAVKNAKDAYGSLLEVAKKYMNTEYEDIATEKLELLERGQQL